MSKKELIKELIKSAKNNKLPIVVYMDDPHDASRMRLIPIFNGMDEFSQYNPRLSEIEWTDKELEELLSIQDDAEDNTEAIVL